MLINKKAVADLARSLDPRKRTRVGRGFLDHVEAAVRRAVTERINHHDNRAGGRKTLT